MYCKNCGRKLDDGERICPVCGHSNIKTSELNAIANYSSYRDDYNFWYALLCFFAPYVGLVLYIIWHKTFPLKAHSCGKGALAGLIVQLVLGLIIGLFFLISICSRFN